MECSIWYGVVSDIKHNTKYPLKVLFKNKTGRDHYENYSLNGFKNSVFDKNQTLFWKEIKYENYEKPKPKPKIELNERNIAISIELNKIYPNTDDNYIINVSSKLEKGFYLNGLFRDDIETAEKTFKSIKEFTRLLALRDQECPDSRGYEFKKGVVNYSIFFHNEEKKWVTYFFKVLSSLNVYFKTEDDAQKICDILNNNQFNLGGENES